MRDRNWILKFFKEIVYAIVMSVYLIKLNYLNQELSVNAFSDSFELLQYREFLPVKYFAAALILFLVGCVLISCAFRNLLEDADSFEEVMMFIVVIVILLVLLVLLFVFINNPILRAIFTVGATIAIGISCINK